MENREELPGSRQPGKGPGRKNGNLLVFLFFLILSFIFWYLNSLSKEIDTSLSYPVDFINIPGGNPKGENLPARLSLTLKGHGYSILKLKLSGNRHPVVVDLSMVSYHPDLKSKPESYYLITAPLITGFNTQLMSECKITSVKPDTIFFSLKK
jgi:hypothetical protein